MRASIATGLLVSLCAAACGGRLSGDTTPILDANADFDAGAAGAYDSAIPAADVMLADGWVDDAADDSSVLSPDTSMSDGSAEDTTDATSSSVDAMGTDAAPSSEAGRHAAPCTLYFGSVQHLSTGGFPHALTATDLNGDSKTDLIVCDSNTISVYLGRGDGTFDAPTQYGAGDYQSIAIGDVNEDGHKDMVVVNVVARNLSLFLGNGDGTFQPETFIVLCPPSASCPPMGYTEALADLNGDGHLDVGMLTSTGFNVLFGGGDGTFAAPGVLSSYSIPGPLFAMATGDFNQDGRLDIAFPVDTSPGTLDLFIGGGDGTFQGRSVVGTRAGDLSENLAAGDLDGDGKTDVVVSDWDAKSLSVFLGVGFANFQPASTWPVEGDPRGVALADVSGDGVLDAVVSNSSDNSVSVLLGAGDGTFFNQQVFGVGQAPEDVVVADLDGDGTADIVVAETNSMSLGLLLDRTCLP